MKSTVHEKHGMGVSGLGLLKKWATEILNAGKRLSRDVQPSVARLLPGLTIHRASQTMNTIILTIPSIQSNGSPRPHVPQTPTIRKGNQTRLRFDPGARKLATPQPARPLTPLPKTQTAASNQAQT